MRSHKIAAIPGDGIGPEVIAAGLEVLEVCAERDGGFRLDVERLRLGLGLLQAARRDDAGRRASSSCAASTRSISARWARRTCPTTSPSGACGSPICQPLDQYANVRPTRVLPGITSPLRNVSGKELDWVIVRENSEGEYAGLGGRSHRGLPNEVATEVVDLHPRRRRRASCASPSRSPARGRASCSPSSPSRTRSATAW